MCYGFDLKKVSTTSKGDQYLKTHQYTILTKVVDEATQARLLKLHDKLSIVWPTLREVIFFLFISFKDILKDFVKIKK